MENKTFYIHDDKTNQYLIHYEHNDNFGYHEGYVWVTWYDFEEMKRYTDDWYFYADDTELLERYEKFVKFFDDEKDIKIHKTGVIEID
ncbi:hypothetical protein ACFO26_06990 [Lactococcus nasutitermitis]|uniref:Uncharacterized protein n=1 Tax=Lactococcus nasutitermitis TaxID=1652957 RepID=A0ABV9JD22_9LACT|nr:hypothetical protein [Lactococcus nasutitermitis]